MLWFEKNFLLTLLYLMALTKTWVPSSSFFRQELGQPRITVLGFMPPNPLVWILNKQKFQNLFKKDKEENRGKSKRFPERRTEINELEEICSVKWVVHKL